MTRDGKKCKGKNKKGEPCGAYPLKGADYCKHHAPDNDKPRQRKTSFWRDPKFLTTSGIAVVGLLLTIIFFFTSRKQGQQESARQLEKIDSLLPYLLSTDEDHPELTTPVVHRQTSRPLRFELIPNKTRVANGEELSIDCFMSGELGHRHDPTLGGFTLVVLWNINQLEFRGISFGTEFGDETESMRSYSLLEAGVFNPADPEFAAIIFSHHTHLTRDNISRLQTARPRIAVLSFSSRTDEPIRINAGFPYAQNSLLDSQRRPTLSASVSALFLNQGQ